MLDGFGFIDQIKKYKMLYLFTVKYVSEFNLRNIHEINLKRRSVTIDLFSALSWDDNRYIKDTLHCSRIKC